MIQTLDSLDFQRIVTADPHVMHCLRNEYPALGGRYAVEHHAATLAPGQNRQHPPQAAGIVRAPDLPTLLPWPAGETEAPRELLARLGAPLRKRAMAWKAVAAEAAARR